MIYGMMISAILTFAILALAKVAEYPYWVLLLHLQEISLCFFLFFIFGFFLQTLEKSGGIIRVPPGIASERKSSGRWKLLLAVLFAFAALAYRYSTFKAFAAMQDADPTEFNPWLSRGNLFSITSATLAALLAMRRLKADNIVEKSLAYISASAALLSLAPLASPLGIDLLHPLTFLLTALEAAFLYALSLFITKRRDIL